MGEATCCDGATFNNSRANKVSITSLLLPALIAQLIAWLFNYSECMVLGCLASWAVNVLFQWDALPFYLVHILVWFLSDWIMLSVVQVSVAVVNPVKPMT